MLAALRVSVALPPLTVAPAGRIFLDRGLRRGAWLLLGGMAALPAVRGERYRSMMKILPGPNSRLASISEVVLVHSSDVHIDDSRGTAGRLTAGEEVVVTRQSLLWPD